MIREEATSEFFLFSSWVLCCIISDQLLSRLVTTFVYIIDVLMGMDILRRV